MSSVGQVVDRVFREYLYAADDQPAAVRVTDAIAAADTSFTIATSTLTPEESALLGFGVVIEVGTELMRVRSLSGSALTVDRGVLGTTPADHDADTLALLAPSFTRRGVFDAVADSVVSLHPELFRTVTADVALSSGLGEIPADLVSIQRVRVVSGTSFYDPEFEFLADWTDSSTGRALHVGGVTGTARVTYRARFARPEVEAEDMEVLGVRPEWERIVVVGAAAQIIAGRDVDAATMNFVTEQLRAEQFPTGSSQRIRDGLLRLHRLLLDQARRSLHAEQPERVQMAPVGGSW